MKLPEHIALSYLLAQLGVQEQYGAPGTALMIAAGLLPDLDGLTVLGGWRAHRRFHRVLGHGLPISLLGPLALALLGAFWIQDANLLLLWLWLQLSLLIHLASDVCFYRWPVQLFWPLSPRGPGFGWIGWNDLVPTLLLYGGVAAVLAGPAVAAWSAAGSLSAICLYVAWCAAVPRAEAHWLTGGWARGAPRLCRWLTGDFVT